MTLYEYFCKNTFFVQVFDDYTMSTNDIRLKCHGSYCYFVFIFFLYSECKESISFTIKIFFFLFRLVINIPNFSSAHRILVYFIFSRKLFDKKKKMTIVEKNGLLYYSARNRFSFATVYKLNRPP